MATNFGLASRLPRNAKRILKVGGDGDPLVANHARFNPDGRFTTLPSKKDDDKTGNIFTRMDRLKGEFDCIVQYRYFNAPINIRSGYKGYEKLQTRDGCVFLISYNPYYFEQMTPDQIQGMGEGDLRRVAQSGAAFRKTVLTEFSNSKLSVNKIFQDKNTLPENIISKVRSLTRNSEAAEQDILNVLATRFYAVLLTRKPVRQLLLQSRNLKPVGGVNGVRMSEPFEAMRPCQGLG